MRYSRKQSNGKDLYIATTLILVSELLKFLICIILLLIQKSGSPVLAWKALNAEVLLKPWETAKLAIPSSLYTIQNNLILLALSYLDAATFQASLCFIFVSKLVHFLTFFMVSQQVTYQLKILTTAFFSVLLLRKELKPLQWLSLFILMGGVVLVQVCY